MGLVLPDINRQDRVLVDEHTEAPIFSEIGNRPMGGNVEVLGYKSELRYGCTGSKNSGTASVLLRIVR